MACLFPVDIKNPLYGKRVGDTLYIQVPCGKCSGCLNTRVNSWIFRLLEEEKTSISAHFVTLTYGDNETPGWNYTENGYNTLVKRDFQLFMKKLRKHSPKFPTIKYFAVGEYGSKRHRPHYHAVIFNADVDLIKQNWSHGFVHIGKVSGASIAYTLKYMHKGKIIPQFDGDDRLPEFQLFSKGLGVGYLNPTIKKYHTDDLSRNYVTFPGGHKSTLPRYYRERIYTKHQLSEQAKLSRELKNKREETSKFEYLKTYGKLDLYYRSLIENTHASEENFLRRANERNKNF